MKQSHCLGRFLRSLSGCLIILTPLLWALEFQSPSPVKLNQFLFWASCQQTESSFFIKWVTKKISFFLLTHYRRKQWIFHFNIQTREIRILFEEDDNFVANGILFVLTHSSRWMTKNNWSFWRWRHKRRAYNPCCIFFFFLISERTFLRENMIRFIWVEWNSLCRRLMLCSING